MQLYHTPLSAFSQKVRIAMHEKGIDYHSEIIDLFDPDAKAAYRDIYPMGKVPLLKTEDGSKIPESTIIVEYLQDNFSGGTRLIPGNADDARQVRLIDRLCDLYFTPKIGTLFFDSMKPESERDPQACEEARRCITLHYQYVEQLLQNQTWLCGDHFTLADCSAIPSMLYAETVMPFSNYRHLMRYWEQAQQRSSYQQLLQEVRPIWEQFSNRS